MSAPDRLQAASAPEGKPRGAKGAAASAKVGAARHPNAEGLRQAMSWLHTWAGLIFGWVLFAMFLTGSLAFFRPEITQWMQPEAHVAPVPVARSVAVAQAYLQAHAPEAARWFISPSSAREPGIRVTYPSSGPATGGRRFQRVTLDPGTGEALSTRDTRGGEFLYRFHFELEMGFPWGRWLASIAGMFMLVAIISGIITHKKIFADFFTFRPRKGGQRAWMDGHNVLSVLGLPFHLMITFSGLVIFAAMLLPAGILASYDSERQYFDDVFPSFAVQKPTGRPGSLVPLEQLVEQATRRWQGGSIGRIVVNNPGDAAAVVSLSRATSDAVSYGRLPPSLSYSGTTGELLHETTWESPVAQTAGTIIGLHLGLYAQPLLRWLYFAVSMAGTAMVGTGLVLWVAKRRQKLRPGAAEPLSLRMVGVLNAGSIAGLCLAVAAYFWANRLLPFDLAGRAQWEVRVFFGVWAASFVYALTRPGTRWRDLCALAAGLFVSLPLLNAFTTSRHLGASLPAGDWIMAGFDLAVIAAGLLMAWIARKAARPKAAAHSRQARRGPAPAARDLPSEIVP